jgi:hypothetical protein
VSSTISPYQHQHRWLGRQTYLFLARLLLLSLIVPVPVLAVLAGFAQHFVVAAALLAAMLVLAADCVLVAAALLAIVAVAAAGVAWEAAEVARAVATSPDVGAFDWEMATRSCVFVVAIATARLVLLARLGKAKRDASHQMKAWFVDHCHHHVQHLQHDQLSKHASRQVQREREREIGHNVSECQYVAVAYVR